MVVMHTNFQHKRIHKITWLSADQNTASQIDHIIINAINKVVIENVRSIRGPNINSDHFLAKAVIKKIKCNTQENIETSTEMDYNKFTKSIKT
jgi:hypothetical protein